MRSSWSSTVISAELTGFDTPVWLLNMVATSLSSPFNVPQPYPTPVNAELAPRVPECNSRPYIHVAGRWITQCKSTQDRTKRQREQQRTTCKRSILPRRRHHRCVNASSMHQFDLSLSLSLACDDQSPTVSMQ